MRQYKTFADLGGYSLFSKRRNSVLTMINENIILVYYIIIHRDKYTVFIYSRFTVGLSL